MPKINGYLVTLTQDEIDAICNRLGAACTKDYENSILAASGSDVYDELIKLTSDFND